MSLPGIGTSFGAQAANNSVAATADVNGSAKFVGPSGIQGSTVTCVVTVPNAPPTAVFTATLGTIGGQGVVVDTWGGESTAGRFQVLVGQTLVVTGTGLSPQLSYTCTFATVTDVGTVEVTIPDTNSSAIVAQIGVPTLLINNKTVVSGVGFGIVVPAGVRTLVLLADAVDGVTNDQPTNILVAADGVPHFPIYNQPPYMISPNGDSWIACTLPPFLEAPASLDIVITGPSAGGYLVTAYGDSAQYPESIYYNGPVQFASTAQSVPGTYALLFGPARILTAQLEVSGANAVSLIIDNAGKEVARADAGSGGGVSSPAAIASLSWPPNSILKSGEQLQLDVIVGGAGTTATAMVTYAYP